MSDKHEPDPRFLDNLEWQLSGELRRLNRSGASDRLSIRLLKIAAIVVVSIGLGAGVMGASQQLQESWRKDLLETRLAVQVEIAQHRVEVQQESVEQMREDVRQGLRESRDLAEEESQIAQARSLAELLELTLEEIRQSGREPLGELSSPLVGGRDFVSERINVQMRMARLSLGAVQRLVERTRSLAGEGNADDIDRQGWDLTVSEAELKLDKLAKQLEVRRAFVESEITAVEAELKFLEVDVQNRIDLLGRQLQYAQNEVQSFRDMADAGTAIPSYASRVQTWAAEIEARLRLAQTELGIIQRELAKRAGMD